MAAPSSTVLFDLGQAIDLLTRAISSTNDAATVATMDGMFSTEYKLDCVVLELSKQRIVLNKLEQKLLKQVENGED